MVWQEPRNETTNLVGHFAVLYRPISKSVPLAALPRFETPLKIGELGPYLGVLTGSCTDEILG